MIAHESLFVVPITRATSKSTDTVIAQEGLTPALVLSWPPAQNLAKRGHRAGVDRA
jgi:hypothetical protein